MTVPAPCRKCNRLTWTLRQLCPWCEKIERDKEEAEREEWLKNNPPVFKTKRHFQPDWHYMKAGHVDQARAKWERIKSEGLSIRLADG